MTTGADGGVGVFLFDVLGPMVGPLAARPGDVLVVAPGTAHPMRVVRRGSSRVLREAPANYTALAQLIADGVLAARSERGRQAVAWAAAQPPARTG